MKKTQAEPGFDPAKLYTIYYDEKLNEISRSLGKKTQLDPRLRPWYKQATETPSATKPYLFFDSKIVGLSAMSKTPEPGVVVMFDITLKNLSKTISKYQVTPSSEVVLINAEGQTFAYKDQKKIVVSQIGSSGEEKLQLANLSQLGSGVLSHMSGNIEAKEQNFDFNFNKERWIEIGRAHV